MNSDWLLALVGGAIIGIAVSMFLLLNGRIAGVSGILSDIFRRNSVDRGWRIAFVLGLVAGGLVMSLFLPAAFPVVTQKSFFVIAVAGLLVGFGTVIGNGCTSGHGVCGISRLSKRSIVATMTFMLAGVVTVALIRWILMAQVSAS